MIGIKLMQMLPYMTKGLTEVFDKYENDMNQLLQSFQLHS